MSIELQLMSSSNIWIVPKMLVDIKVDTHFTEINDWPKYVFQVILWQFVNCMTWVQILQINNVNLKYLHNTHVYMVLISEILTKL